MRAVIERLGDAEIAIPCEDEWHHPLAAVYRTGLGMRCRKLIAAGQPRPLHLVQASVGGFAEVGGEEDQRGRDEDDQHCTAASNRSVVHRQMKS